MLHEQFFIRVWSFDTVVKRDESSKQLSNQHLSNSKTHVQS